jgi:hypothetical protein
MQDFYALVATEGVWRPILLADPGISIEKSKLSFVRNQVPLVPAASISLQLLLISGNSPCRLTWTDNALVSYGTDGYCVNTFLHVMIERWLLSGT